MASAENAVQRACLEYLSLLKIPAWRSNNFPVRTANGSFRSFAGMKGVPDIIGLLPARGGRWLGIECKSAKGKQSPEQKAFQEMIEDAGGVYLLVRSLKELEEALVEMPR